MQNTNKVVTAEIWRDVAGYNGVYQVSSMGRVRSTDRVIKVGNHTRFVRGRSIQSHNNGLGYMQVILIDTNHESHAMSVHKLVLDTFMPLSDIEASTLTDVDHID